jgi:hypothetical protein
MPATHLARFTADVTPPLGHPLCGGWIEPAKAIDDPLRALGIVLLGAEAPVVLCALDWCGLRNEANWAWKTALARAAHTTFERVAVQCVHPHDAPFADLGAQRLLAAAGAASCIDVEFFDKAIERTAAAVSACLAKPERVTHWGKCQAQVSDVASNRRVLGPDGKVKFWRGSSTRDAKAREEPVGLIDPWLKSLSFWNGAEPLAALHYYATHPMSNYGQGRVSSDFCGLARQKRQDDLPAIRQIYFTGCAGNVAAGKYNDGNPANRPLLRDRIYQAMKDAWAGVERRPLSSWTWRNERVTFEPRPEALFSRGANQTILADQKATPAKHGNAAFQLAWLDRLRTPVAMSCLDLGEAAVVNLPGEPFIEYQLFAQAQRPDNFICCAGYGDGGPGYIPTRKAFGEEGYEVGVALAAASCEEKLQTAIRRLLGR